MRTTHLVRALVVLMLAAVPASATAQQTHQHSPGSEQQRPATPSPGMPAKDPSTEQPKEPIPPLTDADRKAAFPEGLGGHAAHGGRWHYYVLFDQLEWQGSGSGGVEIENRTWIGGDANRLWLRPEVESDEGEIENASIDALWGHSFSRWWDVVAGVRQDFRPGDPQTWGAFGIQGLAPYWFEIEATGYVSADGRTRARFDLEYELLLTNRVVLQPVAELELFGRRDPARGIGAGLSSIEAGLRLRYEIRRELAPYIGITWDRKLFGTADLARTRGEAPGKARFAFGLRTWF